MVNRPHIDGLRGVAVLAVVLYHMGLGAFRGGFVGVDVFFVISGYLIASILAGDLEQGTRRFSLAAFYDRRIRRIFPALFVVLLVTTVLASAILLPRDLNAYGRSLVATAAFVSNIHLQRQVGYFDAEAHTKPLLHMWSLAVEEQFYLLFPLLMFALFRWFGGRVGARRVLAGIGVASLAWSAWQVQMEPSAAFYLAGSRAWELLMGAVLALGALPAPRGARTAELSAAAGIVLLAFAIIGYSASTPFPGLAALVPCIGAALLIHSGDRTLVSRLLAWRPLVHVGLISYSLYLWHWVLLSLARHWALEPLGLVSIAAVVAVAAVASELSWRFVERPFRAHAGARVAHDGPPVAAPNRGRGSRRVLVWGGATVAVTVAAGVLLVVSDGWSSRLSQRVRTLDAAQLDFNQARPLCHASDRVDIPYRNTCRFGARSVAPRFALWGDSHAAELSVALGELAALNGESVRMITYSACPPGSLPGGEPARTAGCMAHETSTLRAITADTTLAVVFLVARYTQARIEQGDRFFDELGRVAHALADAGLAVVLVYPAPEFDFSVPVQLARAEYQGKDLARVGLSRSAFDRQRAPAVHALDAIRRDGRIGMVDPARLLCDAERCRVIAYGLPLYFDDDHLSVSGARFVAPVFASYFGPTRPAAP